MKVGILTFHRVYNFGANLQALSMQEAIRANGASPIFINYQDPAKLSLYKQMVPKSQASAHESFFSDYLSESQPLYSENEIKEYCEEELDAVIVGSDAVLRLDAKYDPFVILKNLKKNKKINLKNLKRLPPYWLYWENSSGSKSIIKAAVAASSMGTLYFLLPSEIKKKIKRAINDFDYIYVRDDWTEKMINTISGKDINNIQYCPDPVFTLNKNLKNLRNESLSYDTSQMVLLSGSFHPAWVRELKGILNNRGYKLGTLPNPDIQYPYDVDLNIPLPIEPLQWYQLIANSAGFIGIRFHALVSAIANSVPAICIDNLTTSLLFKSGSKTYDLCKRVGLKKSYYNKINIKFAKPECVVNNLFEPNNVINARRWAEQAIKDYENSLNTILCTASGQVNQN